MRAVNLTKGTVLAETVREARTFWTRMVGLLGKDTLPSSEGLLLRPALSIHTFFMRFPIDVIFVDGDQRVVRTVLALRPFRLAWGGLRSRVALELPVGSIDASRTTAGDALRFEL